MKYLGKFECLTRFGAKQQSIAYGNDFPLLVDIMLNKDISNNSDRNIFKALTLGEALGLLSISGEEVYAYTSFFYPKDLQQLYQYIISYDKEFLQLPKRLRSWIFTAIVHKWSLNLNEEDMLLVLFDLGGYYA